MRSLQMAIKKVCLRKIEQTQYTIYDELDSFDDHEELFRDLRLASEDDEIMIRLITPGGRVDVGMALIHAIRNSAAYVKMVVEYPCYSMGALLALSGDGLEMYPDTFLMFHDYSGGMYGKGNEMVLQTGATTKALKGMLSKAMSPFLTKREIASIFNGRDLYVHADQPDVRTRLERHFKKSRKVDSTNT